MAILVLGQNVEARIKAERRTTGADRLDEVWEGLYVVSPEPNDEHQELVSQLIYILQGLIKHAGLGEVRPGVNVSDRDVGWEQNYRVPDIAVFLKGGIACNRDTHWVGGPDFALEILSPGDRAHEKIPF
ncbi:MAG TPA: Uma2 family endonuclease [Isosphaeraceae bacterium]|jgi:Uma2 family endonuclease|nr:Uma2 family endonuclease [Isosphaeraceae bacterium]